MQVKHKIFENKKKTQPLPPILMRVRKHGLANLFQSLQKLNEFTKILESDHLGVGIFFLTGEKSQKWYTPSACNVTASVFSLAQN
jgi:hypothetical protein